MPQENQIWSEIKFDEEDFETFRRGISTERQAEKILRRKQQIRQAETGCQYPLFLLIFAPFALIFGGFLLYVVISAGSRAFSIILILAAFALAGALLVLFQISRMRRAIKGLDVDLQNKRVVSATGQAKVIYEDDSSRILYLLIDNLTLFAAWFGDFKTDETQVYLAYFLPESKILLAVEKA